MSDSIDTGGPAFPVRTEDPDRPSSSSIPQDLRTQFPGMTLRDWFAGQALAGAMADHLYNPSPYTMAEDCYKVADAMIAQRNNTK